LLIKIQVAGISEKFLKWTAAARVPGMSHFHWNIARNVLNLAPIWNWFDYVPVLEHKYKFRSFSNVTLNPRRLLLPYERYAAANGSADDHLEAASAGNGGSSASASGHAGAVLSPPKKRKLSDPTSDLHEVMRYVNLFKFLSHFRPFEHFLTFNFL
jgi:hypothetical protein